MSKLTSYNYESLWAVTMWFANEMQRELNNNDHKCGWEDLSARWLLMRLDQEVRELKRAVTSGKNIVSEAADVANFAMMIADIYNTKDAQDEAQAGIERLRKEKIND